MIKRTTPDAVASGPATGGRGGRRRRMIAGLTAATLAASAGVLTAAVPASAAVPTYPDNITVFPDRDFVSIDGYAAHGGEPVTIELLRGGTVVGSATGPGASKAAIEAGNPIIEVNHPGGICWGAGGGINATPDILPGDQVVVKFGGAAAGDATTLDTNVTDAALDPADPTKLIVRGRYGPDVNPAFLEQRIINPDLRTTDVNFRDVRAVPGPLTPDRRSPTAYSSMLTTANGAFTATYQFGKGATAAVAAAGAMRAMSWQNQDANANRQGVTIAEAGESGGPGFGGCPAAAAAQGPAAPTNVKAVDNAGTTTVTWTRPTVNPGGSPILGYTVRSVTTASNGTAQDEIGKRISDPAATTVDLPVALAGHTVEVRSLTAAGESWPPAIANKTGTGTGAAGDTTPPTVAAAPPGGRFTAAVSVTLTANEQDAGIYYTLDGSDPLVSTDAGPTSMPYTGPVSIPVAAGGSTTLRYVAIDAAGNPSLARTEVYTFSAASGPAAPTGVTAKASNTTTDVTWTAPANAGTSPITGYTVTATPPTGAPISVTTLASATTASLTGLTNGTTYSVTVTARNADGPGSPSTAVSVTPNATERLTATAPVNKAGDFRVKGTSNAPSGSVSLFRTDAAGKQTGAALATSPLTAAVAPATGTAFDLRARATLTAGTKLVIVGTNGGTLAVTA